MFSSELSVPPLFIFMSDLLSMCCKRVLGTVPQIALHKVRKPSFSFLTIFFCTYCVTLATNQPTRPAQISHETAATP